MRFSSRAAGVAVRHAELRLEDVTLAKPSTTATVTSPHPMLVLKFIPRMHQRWVGCQCEMRLC